LGVCRGVRHGSDELQRWREMAERVTSWAFAGVLAVLSSAMILSYYNIVAGWALGYVVEMMQGHFAINGDFDRFAADWLETGFYAMAFMFTTAIIVASGVKDGSSGRRRSSCPPSWPSSCFWRSMP
jgi:SNF family Na+-dependent transporter